MLTLAITLNNPHTKCTVAGIQDNTHLVLDSFMPYGNPHMHISPPWNQSISMYTILSRFGYHDPTPHFPNWLIEEGGLCASLTRLRGVYGAHMLY